MARTSTDAVVQPLLRRRRGPDSSRLVRLPPVAFVAMRDRAALICSRLRHLDGGRFEIDETETR